MYRGAHLSQRLPGIDHILMEDFNLSPLQIGGVSGEHQPNHSVFNQQVLFESRWRKDSIDEVCVCVFPVKPSISLLNTH